MRSNVSTRSKLKLYIMKSNLSLIPAGIILQHTLLWPTKLGIDTYFGKM